MLYGYYLCSDRFQLQCEICKKETDVIDNDAVGWHLTNLVTHTCMECEGV